MVHHLLLESKELNIEKFQNRTTIFLIQRKVVGLEMEFRSLAVTTQGETNSCNDAPLKIEDIWSMGDSQNWKE